MILGTVWSLEPAEDYFQARHNLFIPSEVIAT